MTSVNILKKIKTQAPELQPMSVTEALELVGMDLIGIVHLNMIS